MVFTAGNNRQVLLRRLKPEDLGPLHLYLQKLGPETKRRFCPHGYDQSAIEQFYQHQEIHLGYVGVEVDTAEIITYTVVKMGYLEHDSGRLRSYGMLPDHRIDCTFAPSVSDAWQSMGVGNAHFRFIVSDLKTKGVRRIILWGGVQKDNEKAVNFYLKNDFRLLGEFNHNGMNYDMIYLVK